MADSNQKKLDAVDQKINALKAKLARENMITLVVSLLLLLVIFGYFGYGYFQIKSILVPETLVNLAGNTIDDNLPQVKTAIRDEVVNNAPIWAEELSNQAIDTVPSMREKIEEYSLKGIDTAVDRSIDVTSETFRSFLQDNRADIEGAIAELEANGTLSDATMQEIETALNSQLQTSLEDQANQVLVTLNEINSKLKYLRDADSLAPIEQKQLEFLMVLRRMHMRELERSRNAQANAATG